MKKKKYLYKEVTTDCNTKLALSTTTTSIVGAHGETKGLCGLAIILTDIEGKTLNTHLSELQLDEFINQLNRLQNIVKERNHPSPIKCPF